MTTTTTPVMDWVDRSPDLSADDIDRIDAAYVRDGVTLGKRHKAQLRGELPVPVVSDVELAAYRRAVGGHASQSAGSVG